ncbi:MAG: sugar phosphate isomerase/epimerase, partial [Clostridia bacterium]|nr:sugar phosphate isomerase/epimerase [Clostridia bacterium]
IEVIIAKSAEFGFAGIEFSEGARMNETDAAARVKAKAAECGLEVVALCVGADFINGSGADTKTEVARVQKMVDFAEAMGAARMRHDVTGGFRGVKICRGYDDALKILAPAIYEVAAYAEQKGIGTMTENHGFFSQDAARVEKLINTVAHPNFGALVDLGNFMCADEDPTVSVGIMAPYAVHVHAKDFHYKSGMLPNPGKGWFQTRAGNYLRGAIIGHGEAKVMQSINLLKKAGYDGYVTVEFEGMEDKLLGISLGKENLQSYIG